MLLETLGSGSLRLSAFQKNGRKRDWKERERGKKKRMAEKGKKIR